jgi:hypothetical protein
MVGIVMAMGREWRVPSACSWKTISKRRPNASTMRHNVFNGAAKMMQR